MSTSTTKAEPKHTSNHRADGGLTAQHVRILTHLRKVNKAVSFSDIASADDAKHEKTVRWSLGSIKPDNRDPLSLVGRGFVKQTTHDTDAGKDHLYAISAEGCKALERHEKAAKAKATETNGKK
jgi:hypothetical protein